MYLHFINGKYMNVIFINGMHKYLQSNQFRDEMITFVGKNLSQRIPIDLYHGKRLMPIFNKLEWTIHFLSNDAVTYVLRLTLIHGRRL